MSRARRTVVGTEPPEPPGEAIAATVEEIQQRVLGDLDDVLAPDGLVPGPPPTETPD